jgi:hypothetical protein
VNEDATTETYKFRVVEKEETSLPGMSSCPIPSAGIELDIHVQEEEMQIRKRSNPI